MISNKACSPILFTNSSKQYENNKYENNKYENNKYENNKYENKSKYKISDDDAESIKNDNSSVQSKEIIPKAPIIKTIVELKYIPKKDKIDTEYIFEIKKTDISDVYILNVVESVDKNGKTFMKRKKIGLAFIPNVKKSKWCREIMEDNNNGVLINCIYHEDKYKWEPMNISSAKRPSFISDFDIIKV